MHDERHKGKRLALVGFAPELGELLELVLGEDEGYDVQSYAAAPGFIDQVAQQHPDLILMEIGLNQHTLISLDALRADARTRSTPVIVLGSLERVQTDAQAAGNVCAVLPKPFDLEALLVTISEALAGTPFEARIEAYPPSPDQSHQEAADLLARAGRAVTLDWVQAIRQVAPFADRPDLSTREFLDSVPRILNALTLVLRHEVGADVFTGDEDMQMRIRQHAETRLRQGLTAEAAVREYQVLRQVLEERLRRALPAEPLQGVMDQLNDLLDQSMRITIAEFTRLRDEGLSP